MFAVGHIALGYVIAKTLDKVMGLRSNIPLIWTLSLLPDIDFLTPGVMHRGPTHSLALALIVFSPFIITKPRESTPYFVALITHSAIGDFITRGGVMFFWPFSTKMVQMNYTLIMGRPLETYVEMALFTSQILLMIATRDYESLFEADERNLYLLVPLFAIFLPVGFKYPIRVPRALLVSHLIVLGLLAFSILKSMIRLYNVNRFTEK